MRADSDELLERLTAYAGRTARVAQALPRTQAGRHYGDQLLRSGSSVGAHYAEARRAKSTKDFISKVQGGLQELNEAEYWLTLIGQTNLLPAHRLTAINDETNQLLSILTTMARNAKSRLKHR
jgi:four helix bundle protein